MLAGRRLALTRTNDSMVAAGTLRTDCRLAWKRRVKPALPTFRSWSFKILDAYALAGIM
jgi:hypothetical protein